MLMLPKLPKMPKGNFYQNALAGFGFATGIYVASFVLGPLLDIVIEAVDSRCCRNKKTDESADVFISAIFPAEQAKEQTELTKDDDSKETYEMTPQAKDDAGKVSNEASSELNNEEDLD